jgi:hypothetical protein
MRTNLFFLRTWIFIGPLVLMCCFGVALFLISSTIILSIIPTYLPIRDRPTTSSSLSAPQSVILELSSGNSVPVGSTLSTENQNSIQNQVRNSFINILINLFINNRCKQL